MNIHKMKNKYIVILFAFVLAVLCFTMGTRADDSASGTNGGSSAGTSEGTSTSVFASLRSTNISQTFSSMNLEMWYGTGTMTQVTSLTEIPDSPTDLSKIEYRIKNATVADVSPPGIGKVDLSQFTITYPDTLTMTTASVASTLSVGTTTNTGNTNSVIITVSTSGTPSEIEAFLNSTTFKLVTTSMSAYPPDSSAIKIGGVIRGTGATFFEDENGNVHMYQRYTFAEVNTARGQPSGTTVTWQDAYNFARKQPVPTALQSQNQYGYLATITSQKEQNIIYKDIATQCGWLGGTRALLSNQKIAGGMDDTAISNVQTDYDLSVSTATQWYWACGPEAGKTFYGQPTYTTNYNPIMNTPTNTTTATVNGNTDTRPGDDLDASGVDIKYNYFTNQQNNGSRIPSGSFGILNFASTNKEPNNSGNVEAYLQFAWSGSPAWNDYSATNNTSMTAVYVEWGGYSGDRLRTDISLDIPQPVVVQYKLNWNDGDAIEIGSPASVKDPLIDHYFFGQLAETDNSTGSPVSVPATQTEASDFIDDITGNSTYGEPISSIGLLKDHFEIMPSLLPTTYPTCSEIKQTITYVYWGIEMDLEYHPNNGQFPGSSPDGPITIKSRYMEPLPALPSAQNPTKHSSDLSNWTVGANGSPDNFNETSNIIEYDTVPPAATISPTVTRHTTVGTMEAHAVWTRNAWDLYFDGNGGQLNGAASIQFPLTAGTRTAAADITSYLPDGANQPTWFANAFLGWANSGNIINQGTDSTPGTFTMKGDVYLTAQWLDLAAYVDSLMKDTVIYKDGMTAEEVLVNSGLRPSYTDLLGNTHSIPLNIDFFDQSTISDGGVTAITVTLTDPITGGVITLPRDFVDLYSLNRPFLDGNDTYYMFVGETIPTGNNFNVYLYIETPNFANRSIDSAYVSLDDLQGYIDANLIGIYPGHFDTLFKDFFGDNISLTWPVTTIVREPAGLTKEEKRQVEASEFWVITTQIYHQMKPGQIIEVTESNYKDGGRLLDETIPEGAAYDRQIRVTPGIFYYMNPCILDRIKDDEAGRMDVYLPGRSLTFNSWDFDTDPTISDDVKFDPRSYFDLRMSAVKNEKITTLVGADTMQMQVYFEMNRPWYAEAQFGLTVNDTLKAAADSGKTLYLFNYNENTNELELVGPMTNQGNGYFSTQMNGVYHNYVILAGLPQNGNYRLTNKTNAMDKGTVQQVTQNLKDSGKATVEGEELNAVSTTKKFLNEDKSVAENITAGITTDTTNSKNSNLARGVFVAVIGIVVAGGGVFIYLKKRS